MVISIFCSGKSQSVLFKRIKGEDLSAQTDASTISIIFEARPLSRFFPCDFNPATWPTSAPHATTELFVNCAGTWYGELAISFASVVRKWFSK